jgi:glycosyltransferase involved in cell wall biosynthesis
MFDNKLVVVVLPAFNAGKTLEHVYNEVLAQEFVDKIILVDDASTDDTLTIANSLDFSEVISLQANIGYGGNQKICYDRAIAHGGDIVIMIHPDYQYTPLLIPAMVTMIGSGLYDCVLGSRILGGHAVEDGMPLWRYVSNRLLTLIQNFVIGEKLSEYHTGYRAYSRELLKMINLDANSNDFIFDNQILMQILWNHFRIGEISCPAKYQPESSSINFRRSIVYGFGCLFNSLQYRLAKILRIHSKRFPA